MSQHLNNLTANRNSFNQLNGNLANVTVHTQEASRRVSLAAGNIASCFSINESAADNGALIRLAEQIANITSMIQTTLASNINDEVSSLNNRISTERARLERQRQEEERARVERARLERERQEREKNEQGGRR